MAIDVETAISLVLDALEKKAVLFLHQHKKRRGERLGTGIRFSIGPYKNATGPAGYAIIGAGKDADTYKEFYGPSAAADCARAMVNLCGSASAQQAVNEWKSKSAL